MTTIRNLFVLTASLTMLLVGTGVAFAHTPSTPQYPVTEQSDQITSDSDAAALHDEAADITEESGVCVAWNVNVQDDQADKHYVRTGSSNSVNETFDDDTCDQWVTINVWSHWTCNSCESYSHGAWSISSNIVDGGDLERELGIRMDDDDPIEVVWNVLEHLNTKLVMLEAIPPLPLEINTEPLPEDAEWVTVGDDNVRNNWGKLLLGGLLAVAGVGFLIAGITHTDRPSRSSYY